MIDEVQLCDKFELAINSFHNSKKYDIYLTGSNAFLLSSDLATLFTGRFIEIPVFPFSFEEFCYYFEIKDNYSNHLQDYLKKGGLAGSYVYKNEEDATTYIKDVYTSLIKSVYYGRVAPPFRRKSTGVPREFSHSSARSATKNDERIFSSSKARLRTF